jgi:predicted ester cyclase
VRTEWHGTQQGAFLGFPATGNQVILSAILIHRFEDGKIAEIWPALDMLNALQQLRLIAPPAETEER